MKENSFAENKIEIKKDKIDILEHFRFGVHFFQTGRPVFFGAAFFMADSPFTFVPNRMNELPSCCK